MGSLSIQLPIEKRRWGKKEFRAVAHQLPVSVYKHNIRLTAKAILKETKLEDIEDEKVREKVKFQAESNSNNMFGKSQLNKINHQRRIKRAYGKEGVQGVRNYIAWFVVHHKEIIKEFPKHFKTREGQELIEHENKKQLENEADIT